MSELLLLLHAGRGESATIHPRVVPQKMSDPACFAFLLLLAAHEHAYSICNILHVRSSAARGGEEGVREEVLYVV